MAFVAAIVLLVLSAVPAPVAHASTGDSAPVAGSPAHQAYSVLLRQRASKPKPRRPRGTHLAYNPLKARYVWSRQRPAFSPHFRTKIVLPKVRHRSIGSQLATWYGPGFYGNGTGCGSRLGFQTHGVAHRTLPCGTLLLLSFRGRSIAVPVMDRGPYSGATLDLTAATADFLGVRAYGVGRVQTAVLPIRINPKFL